MQNGFVSQKTRRIVRWHRLFPSFSAKTPRVCARAAVPVSPLLRQRRVRPRSHCESSRRREKGPGTLQERPRAKHRTRKFYTPSPLLTKRPQSVNRTQERQVVSPRSRSDRTSLREVRITDMCHIGIFLSRKMSFTRHQSVAQTGNHVLQYETEAESITIEIRAVLRPDASGGARQALRESCLHSPGLIL